MNFKKISIALAVAGAMAASNVQAGVLATSVLEIKNLVFLNSSTKANLDVADFSNNVALATSKGDESATLNMTTLSDSGSVLGANLLDLGGVCVGDCGSWVNNAFAVVSSVGGTADNPIADPSEYFAAGDQLQFGSPITGVLDENGDVVLVGGATISSASYVSLTSAGTGSASSNNNLNAKFVFELNNAMAIDINFDVSTYLEAFVDGGLNFPSDANAQYDLSFTIVDGFGVDVFSWEPDGNIFGGVVNSNPFDLNDSVNRVAPIFSPFEPEALCDGGPCTGLKRNGSFSVTTNVLAAGQIYTLNATMGTRVDAQAVPEPSVIALMGLGLLGMAGVARRRKSA